MNENERIRSVMKKYGITANKRFGQNFLTSDAVLDDIIKHAELDQNTNVIEIGPGLGGLTQKLLGRVKKLALVEIDPKMIDVLHGEMALEGVSVVQKDILKCNIDALIDDIFMGEDVVVIANLPYYITTPIITKLVEESKKIKRMVVMVQKEVAVRLCGSPDGKDYGAITLLIDYLCEKELLFDVDSKEFLPPPNVVSSVIRLEKRKVMKFTPLNEQFLFRLIKAAFGQRRKTLVNALSSGGIGVGKEDVQKMLADMGLNPLVRGEKLSIEDFVILADKLYAGE